MKNYLIFLFALISLTGTSCTVEHHHEADRQALIKLTAGDWDANFLAGNLGGYL